MTTPNEAAMTEWPTVEVVIPTHNRPKLVRRAIDSARSQDYPGHFAITVVFDRQEPDLALARSDTPQVRVIANDRTPGLPGARNAGILGSDSELVAFLDDDDHWLAGKLTKQVGAFLATDSAMSTTAIEIDFDGIRSVRTAGTDRVTHEQLLASRMSMLHSSGFLFRRTALAGELGLVDESAPSGQNEDWDLLLRASRLAPIVHVDEPLVSVRWGSTSMFADAWRSRIAGALWVLGNHPDVAESRVGYARLLSQIAFGHAALKQRGEALSYIRRALACRPTEVRAYFAVLVVCGLPAGFVQRLLHRFGRGI